MPIEEQEHRFRLPANSSRLLIHYLERTRFLMTYNMEIVYAGGGLFDVRIIPIYFQHAYMTREIVHKMASHLLPVFTDRPWREFAAVMKPREITAMIALRALMRQQRKSRLKEVKLDEDAMDKVYAFARVDPSYKPFTDTVHAVREQIVQRVAKDSTIRSRNLRWVAQLPPELVNLIVKKIPKRIEPPNEAEAPKRPLGFEAESIWALLAMRGVNRMMSTFVDAVLPTTKAHFMTKNRLISVEQDNFFVDFSRRTWDDDEELRTPFELRSVRFFGRLQRLRVNLVHYDIPAALEFVRRMVFEMGIGEVQVDAEEWRRFSAEDRQAMTRFAIDAFNAWPRLRSIQLYVELFDSTAEWQLDWPLDESRVFCAVAARKFALSIRL